MPKDFDLERLVIGKETYSSLNWNAPAVFVLGYLEQVY